MMAVEGDKPSGPADSKHKRQPGPPDAATALAELPSEIGRRRPEFPTASHSKPTGNQTKASLVTIHVAGKARVGALVLTSPFMDLH